MYIFISSIFYLYLYIVYILFADESRMPADGGRTLLGSVHNNAVKILSRDRRRLLWIVLDRIKSVFYVIRPDLVWKYNIYKRK